MIPVQPRTEIEPGAAPLPELPPGGAATLDEVTRWALRARDGDSRAPERFVRATQTEVWRFVAALVDARHADDLTQETFLRAFRALPAFEGRSSARTWLLGIARRACADHIRGGPRRRRLDRRGSPPTRAHPGARPGLRRDRPDLLARLSGDRRSAFALTQVLGLSYAEAAEAEGVPIGTIRSRVARARDELIQALADEKVG